MYVVFAPCCSRLTPLRSEAPAEDGGGFFVSMHFCMRYLTGKGAKITQELHRRGMGFQIAATWPGDRRFEKRLKARHNAPKLCPSWPAAARRPARDGPGG